MDIFVEQLVKKVRDTKDYAVIFGGIAGVLIIIWLLANFVGMFPFMGFVIFVAAAAMIYGLYLIITSVNMEYEYIFTNGAFDVDAIINVRKRKSLTSFNAREIEIMAPCSSSEFSAYSRNPSFRRLYACADKKAEDLFFAVYNRDGRGEILIFSPNDEIKNSFKKFNPGKVIL